MARQADFTDRISQNAMDLLNKSKRASENNPDITVILLEEALADSPESKKIIKSLSSAYIDSGNLGKAIKVLENALITFPGDTEIMHQLANSYAERKWGKKAVAKYIECLENEDIYPELIQDFAEYILDTGEHKILFSKLTDIINKFSTQKNGQDITAVSIAMLYSTICDSIVNKKKPDIEPGFFRKFISENPSFVNKAFFIKVINYMSSTPNESLFINVTGEIFNTMIDTLPEVRKSNDFLCAVADFEISLILFNNDVSPLTALAMRTAKLRFAGKNDDIDNLRYLVFDARLAIVDVLRSSSIDVSIFQKKYPYLWTFISGFVMGAINTNDLKKFAREEIYADLQNASPRLMKIIEENTSASGFASLKKYIENRKMSEPVKKIPKTAMKSAVSSKIAPNSPCPCGSGKKYKKCCGLK